MNKKLIQARCQPPQFIFKLTKMIKDYPNLINFSVDGTQLVILNKNQFIDIVLTQYFRHSNWRSFIRQLNMYNFRKINRGMHTQIFINSLFFKGNQNNFHKIRRKINTRQQSLLYEKQLYKLTQQTLSNNLQIQSSLSIFMNAIFNFKVNTDQVMHDIKTDVEDFCNKKKTKEVKPLLHQIKESFQMIDQSSQKIIKALQNFNNIQKQKNLSNFEITKHSNQSFSQSVLINYQKKVLDEQNDNEKRDLQQKRKKSCQVLGVSIKSSFSQVTGLVN